LPPFISSYCKQSESRISPAEFMQVEIVSFMPRNLGAVESRMPSLRDSNLPVSSFRIHCSFSDHHFNSRRYTNCNLRDLSRTQLYQMHAMGELTWKLPWRVFCNPASSFTLHLNRGVHFGTSQIMELPAPLFRICTVTAFRFSYAEL